MKRLIIAVVLSLSSLTAQATCAVGGTVLAVATNHPGAAYLYVSPTGSWNDFYLFGAFNNDSRTAVMASANASPVKAAYVVGNAPSCVQNGYAGEVQWISAY